MLHLHGQILVCLVLGIGAQSEAPDIAKVTTEQKKAFLELLRKLPSEGEFFTDEGVQKAAPYLHVLLALNKDDITEDHVFALLALSRGLHDAKKEHREFAAKNFGKIAHPFIKMHWAIVLFRYSSEATPEITRFLRESLDDRERKELMQKMMGPDFEKLQNEIRAKSRI